MSNVAKEYPNTQFFNERIDAIKGVIKYLEGVDSANPSGYNKDQKSILTYIQDIYETMYQIDKAQWSGLTNLDESVKKLPEEAAEQLRKKWVKGDEEKEGEEPD